MDIETMRHSTAHVMAAAVCRLYRDVMLDIGPASEGGFYYDFDLSERFSPDDLPAIEKEMMKIVSENLPFERTEVTREEALKMLEAAGQTYKIQRLADIPEGEAITFYKSGEFIDLCRGPHLKSTGEIKAFKLVDRKSVV